MGGIGWFDGTVSSRKAGKARSNNEGRWEQSMQDSMLDAANSAVDAHEHAAGRRHAAALALPPPLVMAAFTSEDERLTLSVRHSITKPVPPSPYAS